MAKTFPVFGKGKSVEAAEKDLAESLKETARALGMELDSPKDTKYTVMVRGTAGSGIGSAESYIQALNEAIEKVTLPVKSELVTICETYAAGKELATVAQGSAPVACYRKERAGQSDL